eukprot:g30922.t1
MSLGVGFLTVVLGSAFVSLTFSLSSKRDTYKEGPGWLMLVCSKCLGTVYIFLA